MNREYSVEDVITLDQLRAIKPIADAYGSNSPYWCLLTERILKTGKHIDDLTVKELREIIEETTRLFNGW